MTTGLEWKEDLTYQAVSVTVRKIHHTYVNTLIVSGFETLSCVATEGYSLNILGELGTKSCKKYACSFFVSLSLCNNSRTAGHMVLEEFCVCWKSTDVSEKHVASIFRVEEWAKQELSVKQVASRAIHNGIFPTFIMLVFCLAYPSIRWNYTPLYARWQNYSRFKLSLSASIVRVKLIKDIILRTLEMCT
jgi:hypothetical protein